MKTWILIVLTVATGICSTATAQDRIRLTNGEWAPYLSKTLPHYGAASHIVAEAFAAVGVATDYGFYPWKRAFKLAQEGSWDGTLVWVYTQQRAKDFYYTDVVVTEAEYLFTLKERALEWTTPADLRGLTIGATLHTVYPTLEKAAQAGILTIERAGNYDNLYRRLLNHRIDAIPQVSQVAKFYLRTTLSQQDRQRIIHSPTVLQERRYHLILSRKADGAENWVRRFNQGLAIIRQNGNYQSILDDLESGTYDR